MITHDLIQGSPEWLAYRATMRNASDAPAMMGCSAYKTRAELLREMHTGVPAEVDIGTQKRFDNGHRAEALARPLAEEFIGAELYAVTGSLGNLSASFDGITLEETECFEHKALNDALRAAFDAMQGVDWNSDAEPGRTLPLMYRVQMEQQLLVSGAERVLFMASAWTADGELIEERHCWYYPDAPLRQQIVDGWAQFDLDLAAYKLPPPAAAPVVAAPVESLPAVAVSLNGALAVQSNLPAFGVALRAFVDRVPKRPSTDQEFADTEAACKALKRAEDALDAAETNALASLADVNEMRRMVADFRDLARATRLASEKMVDTRKREVKEEAVMKARRALDAHIATLNAEIAPMRLQPVAADFAGAIKGKRTLDSVNDALDTALAAAKIAADAAARAIRVNVAVFKAATADDTALHALFADLGTLVHKAGDDFALMVGSRIKAHREAEQAREAARQAAEAQRIAAAEQRAREQAEREAQARHIQDQQAQAAALVPTAPLSATPEGDRGPSLNAGRPAFDYAARQPVAVLAEPATGKQSLSVAPAVAEPATLTLGTICERLQLTVRADFLADVLHVSPARVEGKRPGTYTESQFAVICHQLRSHVAAMAELYAGEPA